MANTDVVTEIIQNIPLCNTIDVVVDVCPVNIVQSLEQVQSDWEETNHNSPAYIQHKPDLSQYATTQDLDGKQDTLQSGVNIKTINHQSLLGSGNIDIQGGGGSSEDTDTLAEASIRQVQELEQGMAQLQADVDKSITDLETTVDNKLEEASEEAEDADLVTAEALNDLKTNTQEKLVSGENIKTINNQSLLGSGNVDIKGAYYVDVTSILMGQGTDEMWNEFAAAVQANRPIVTDLMGIHYTCDSVRYPNENQCIVSAGDQLAHYIYTIIRNGVDDFTVTYTSDPWDSKVSSFNGQIGDVTYTAPVTSVNGMTGAVTIQTGGVQSDWTESDSSSLAYIQNKPNMNDYATTASLASVATSGNYNDLTNKPTIPASPVQSNWNESDTSSLAYIQNKPNISDPGFIKLTNGNKTGLVSSLITYYSTNIGNGAVIEGEGRSGQLSSASGSGSHSEGWYTRATGEYSHAEGENTQASGQGAHAEGGSTLAQGWHSHAEGDSTQALGGYSHAEGNSTITNNAQEHAEGWHNISTKISNSSWGDSRNTLSSIGNGYGTSLKHNAFEVRQNGDIYYADTEKINGSTVYYYTAPMRKLQDAMVTSTTAGVKIEVVNAMPQSPDSNTLYIVL